MNDSDPSPENKGIKCDCILNSEDDEESEERSGNTLWDGSKSELISENKAGKYEDSVAGIRISYRLSKKDVYEFIKINFPYEKMEKQKKKYTAVLAVMFFTLLIFSLVTRNNFYTVISLIPFFSAVGLWAMPLFGIKSLIQSIYNKSEYDVEIFPDKIEVIHSGSKKEFPLDESGRCEITDKLILVYSKTREPLIIPIRSIKPDCLPDIQAMILAGARLI